MNKDKLVINIEREVAKKIANYQFPAMIVSGILGLIIFMYFGLKDLRSELVPYTIGTSIVISSVAFILIYRFRIKMLSETSIELNKDDKKLIESYKSRSKVLELDAGVKMKESKIGTVVRNKGKSILIPKQSKNNELMLNVLETYRQ